MRRKISSTAISLLLVLATTGTAVGQRYLQERLTGTYELDSSRSDNVRARVESATFELPASQRQDVRQSLMQRLEVPEMLSIERRGQTVTIASTLGPPLTITADGRRYNDRGTDNSVQARLSGERLTIAMQNDGNRDYTIAIDPLDSGGLRVTRTIASERLRSPVVIASVYERTSDLAQLHVYDDDVVLRQPAEAGEFYVPDGTRLTASLDTELDTERARDGDRFTMTVKSPLSYDGAVIEGHVSDIDRAGPFTGRSDMKFNFERIRLRSGATYDFVANIDNIRTPDGDDVRIEEGRVEEETSQTEETVKRGGIGAALGAVIGAIAGGGKGAAIGAAVGAGAGAGSVYVTGRQDLELPRGTEFNLQAVDLSS